MRCWYYALHGYITEWKTCRAGSGQCRVNRHQVETWKNLLLIRVDENINFTNASYIEEFVQEELNKKRSTQHVILIFTSVSYIDTTALEELESFNHVLQASGIALHLAEVKGPVMDKLEKTIFLEQLKPGKIFLQTHEATMELGDHGYSHNLR